MSGGYQSIPKEDEAAAPPPAYDTVKGGGAGYQTGGPAVGPSTAVTVVAVQNVGFFTPDPVSMTCTSCHSTIVTCTKPEPGTLTWISCGFLALVGCWLGCCLIPFCIDSMQDIEHSCPNCGAVLGRFHRMR